MILHTRHIQKALHTDTTEHLWAFSEEGFTMLLQNYLREQKVCTIIDVQYGDTNIYKEHRSLIPSLCISKNLTPSVLFRFIHMETNDSSDFIYYNEDVKEVSVKPTEYILG